jgi:hypothetical protein
MGPANQQSNFGGFLEIGAIDFATAQETVLPICPC